MRVVREGKYVILLVDDDEHLLRVLSDSLRYQNFTVVTATKAEDALVRWEIDRPDLVILDLQLRGMNGVEFLQHITETEGFLPFPVLVYTAQTDWSRRLEGIPVDGVLLKPCNEQDLVDRVRRTIASRRVASDRDGDKPVGVLLAEDDVAFAGELTDLFQAAGHSVETVKTGMEILHRAPVSRPDVILMKELLPVIRASAVAPIVAAMPSTRSIPMVLYDAQPPPAPSGTESRVLPPGVRRYLTTPRAHELLCAVEEALGA